MDPERNLNASFEEGTWHTSRMSELMRLPTAEVPTETLEKVRGLLDRAFDGDFADTDWEHTVGGQHVILVEEGEVISHASVVTRDLEVADRSFHTGYLEGVATHPEHQGKGFGARVVTAANEVIRQEYELGALSTDRHSFYHRLGWERWQGPTYVRDDSRLLRTADEDEGIMVLRFGPSAAVDLASALSCEARSGDDW